MYMIPKTIMYVPAMGIFRLMQMVALFCLFQAVMLLIQNPSGRLKINLLGLLLLPGQAGHKIQVIIEHPVLVTVLPLLLHAV